MWYLYAGEFDPSNKHRMLYKASSWVSDRYWIELVGNVLTLDNPEI
jgi:hypothetical protein